MKELPPIQFISNISDEILEGPFSASQLLSGWRIMLMFSNFMPRRTPDIETGIREIMRRRIDDYYDKSVDPHGLV